MPTSLRLPLDMPGLDLNLTLWPACIIRQPLSFDVAKIAHRWSIVVVDLQGLFIPFASSIYLFFIHVDVSYVFCDLRIIVF